MEYLRKCIYIVQIGNNDYINNYLLPQLYPSSHLYKPEQFATILIQQYSEQLKVQMEFPLIDTSNLVSLFTDY